MVQSQLNRQIRAAFLIVPSPVLMSRYDEAQAFVNSCTSYAADVRMQVSLLVAAILGGYHADASQLLVGFCVQVKTLFAIS